MMQTQTLEFDKATDEERAILAAALWHLGKGRYNEATRILVERHNALTQNPELKLYP